MILIATIAITLAQPTANRMQWVFIRCNAALSDGHPFMCTPFANGDNLFDCEARRRQFKREGYIVSGCKLEVTE